MNTKHYLVISGIVGGVIGSLLTALLVSPVTAQRDKFGDIECTSLTVVDAAGQKELVLNITEHGGRFVAMGKDGKPMVGFRITEYGGYFQVDGKGEGSVAIGVNEYGNGTVSTWDKNGNRQ